MVAAGGAAVGDDAARGREDSGADDPGRRRRARGRGAHMLRHPGWEHDPRAGAVERSGLDVVVAARGGGRPQIWGCVPRGYSLIGQIELVGPGPEILIDTDPNQMQGVEASVLQ